MESGFVDFAVFVNDALTLGGIWGVDEYGTVYCILFRDEDPDEDVLELRRTISSHSRLEKVLFNKMPSRKMEQNTSSPKTFCSGRQVYWGGIKFRECQCVICRESFSSGLDVETVGEAI